MDDLWQHLGDLSNSLRHLSVSHQLFKIPPTLLTVLPLMANLDSLEFTYVWDGEIPTIKKVLLALPARKIKRLKIDYTCKLPTLFEDCPALWALEGLVVMPSSYSVSASFMEKVNETFIKLRLIAEKTGFVVDYKNTGGVWVRITDLPPGDEGRLKWVPDTTFFQV
ncbi:hypothetical protein T439DRAFT_360035 [Meredithblackwellia eburnea MCA 4105]